MVRTYDPKKVIVVVGGVPLSGFGDKMVKCTRSTDTFTKKVGVDGIATRSHQHDRSGEIVITLEQSSPSNDVMSALHKLDEETNGGIVPVLIKDALPASGSIGSTFVAAKAWIRKPADADYEKNSTDREWTLDVDEFEVFLGGNLAA
jgi:hypothetical protein